jgi:hypothetical protein
MSIGTLNSQQLRSLVEDKWQRDLDAVAVGLHVAQSWKLPKVVEFDFGKAEVVRADTVFQVREALLDAERSKGRIILLTKLRQGDLGNDVVARLARSRLFAIDHWASLCSLFKAKELDPSICEASLAEALLECAPADGYPPVSAGVLDAGTVWRATCRHVFEMGEREPDLVMLLLWATNKATSARYLNVSEVLKGNLRQRLVSNLGEAADSILRFVDCQTGADALALAVVCQVVFGEGQDVVLDAAAARMEHYHNNKPIPKLVGRALSRIANDAIADIDRTDDPRFAQEHLQMADELLKLFRCEDHAYRSRLTLLGYEQRLNRFGNQITATLANLNQEAIRRCEELQSDIAAHRRAKIGQRTEQLSRTEMALRLLRWLAAPVPLATSFSEMANVYRKELAFVDWARESICRGEDVADLTKAYQQLDEAVLARREQFNQVFAKSLADWTSIGSTFKDVCGVEEVLSQFVAKIAAANNRVLLIVLDGMSWAVCHELLGDIRNEHWFEATLDESSNLPAPIVATVPSVTSYSRASLLSGELIKGDQSTEKRNFEANAALKQVCGRNPPVLFHKKEVTEGARGIVGEDLSKAILSSNNKIVGVVFNAIDDRLSSAQQVREDWTINRISPLGAVLKLARDSGRVVILASDHGHVWHRPKAKLCSGDSGSRWRSDTGDIHEGEITITGNRVREENGRRSVIVPSVETIYYGRQQNGYHGGATPQEMVCPLVILMDRTSTYSGLVQCEYPKPEWWLAPPVASAIVQEPQFKIVKPKKPVGLFDDQMELDTKPVTRPLKSKPVPQPTAIPAAWLDRLFASTGYKDQKDFVRRHAPEDDLVRRCLASLDSSGGIMTPAAFSNVADIPAARLDGLIARIQRLLNVDGYEILTFSRSENRIELNVPKLKRQFDIE